MKTQLASIIIVLATIGAVDAQAADGLQVARLTDSNSMLATLDLSAVKFSECQPLKGEGVAILDVISNAGGMLGMNVAKVQVLEGRCKGMSGYVGMAKLEAFTH